MLLDEWSYWIKQEEIKAGTPVGALLNADESGGVGKQADKLKATKKKLPGRVSAAEMMLKKKAKEAKKKLKMEAEAAAEALEEKTSGNFGGFSAPPNSFGFACGSSATKDLQKFMAVFEPCCAETPEGESLRKEGFELADPNGNGLCSLAELEGYMQKKLMAMYPKKKKTDPDVAMDLFDAFRPSYIRAFTDAKDYKADTGKVIKGTKDATDDDFVSVEEFRLFNVYVIIYAAMFDAFAKIGESRH